MKNKKGFVFGIMGIIYLLLIIFILILLVWFGFRISEGLVAFWEFLKVWWWAIGLAIAGLIWHRQITAVVNWLLGKIGVKV